MTAAPSDVASLTAYLLETFPSAQVQEAMGNWFFFYGDERMVAFATVVTHDEAHDAYSRLARPGHFRLNVGVGKESFKAIAGWPPPADPDASGIDYAATARLFPHPVYARQLWPSVVNPGSESWPAMQRLLAAEPARLFFCRHRFPAPVEQAFATLEALAEGEVLAREAGKRLVTRHPETGGRVEFELEVREQRSSLLLTLYAGAWERERLDAFADAALALFDALEARLGEAADRVVPQSWPPATAAPTAPPRILRRADFKWKVACYDDAPEDALGEYVSLTGLLGVTQFGADILRLAPGDRSTYDHAELHEQEAFLVLAGSCTIAIEGRLHELTTGDCCVTFPGESHFLFNASDAPCEILAFGGPDLVGSGATYPHGRDGGWQARVSDR